MPNQQPNSDEGTLWLGQHIGNYRLVRLLGAGAMGMVFEAVHATVGGQAAIKILRPEVAVRQDIVARFFNEARAANSISHPSIVRVFDCGYAANGAAYLAMEFLSGETLQSRLDHSRQLEVGNSLRIARQMAAALDSAHQHRVIHRDLKPENVMLVPDPDLSDGQRVKILDFGIAKVAEQLGGEPVRTRTDLFMGTPTYMAPEQCRGAKHVTDKSDVYSMGVILYQMLAGNPPFVGDSVGELIAAHLTDEPVPLAELVPHVGPQLSALVHTMLDKKARSRPDMGEVLRSLQQQLSLCEPATALLALREITTPTATSVAQAPGPVAPSDRPTLDPPSYEQSVVGNKPVLQGPMSETVRAPELRRRGLEPPTEPLVLLHIGVPAERQPPIVYAQQADAPSLSQRLSSDSRTLTGTASEARRPGGLDRRVWIGSAGLVGLGLIFVVGASHLSRNRAHPAGAALVNSQTPPHLAALRIYPSGLKEPQSKNPAEISTPVVPVATEASAQQVATEAIRPQVEGDAKAEVADRTDASEIQPSPVAALLQQGRKKLDAREPAAAAVLFSQAVQLDAASAEAIGGLGESNFLLGKFDVAAGQLAAAAKLAPQLSLTRQELLAQALYKTGRFQASAEVCRKLLKQIPTAGKAKQTLRLAEKELALAADLQTMNAAQAEYEKGNFAKAITNSQTVVQRNPARAWRIIGASACNIMAINLANDALKHLDAPGRQFLIYACQRRKIDFIENRLQIRN